MSAEEKEKKNFYTNIEKPKTDKLNYTIKILPNGLKVLFISDPEANKSSAALGVNVGNLIDPIDAQGLSHFCEHLLFMGTKKYPVENEYSDYLSKNSGQSNAYTSSDCTLYYFEVSNEGFKGALDRFAQFFICPEFNEGSVEREINAINSEHSKNKNADNWRLNQLIRSESLEKSSFCKFGTGNNETLGQPNIRDRLLDMYNKYYSSEIMNLCVYSIKPMEELIKIVEELFILVPKRENFVMPRYDEVFPYDSTNLQYFYKIVPIKNQDIIEFDWFLPFCKNYRVKPLRYLSSLFGHEGPNTLTSSLRKDNLITELVSSLDDQGSTLSKFSLKIELTKKGFDNYKEVIIRVLKYIKTIQSLGINERYFNEIKEIYQINFDYQNKLKPIQYTVKYARNLMLYVPEDILTGTNLFKEYNHSLLKKYLDALTLENLNIYFLSQEFEKECNLTEKYYGTKYIKEKFKFGLEEIDAYKCGHTFDYPPINKFIPKNLDVLPLEKNVQKYPEKILENKFCKVWFLKDNKYQLPKAKIGIQMKLPKNLCNNSNVKNYVFSYLLDKIITQELGDISYMANEANFVLNFNFKFYRLKIEMGGFNDSFKGGIIEILGLFKNLNLDTNYHREVLNLQIKEMVKKFKNLFFELSYKVNLHYYKTLITDPKVSLDEVLEFLNTTEIKLEDIINFKKNLFNNVKLDWLIQGNMTKDNALDIVKLTSNILNIDSENNTLKEYYNKRLVNIGKNYNFIYRFKSPNPQEKDSSLISIYQSSHLNEIDIQYFKITRAFLEEKFFDQLRTKETLGYIVGLTSYEKYDVYSLVGIIQSNSKVPEYCSERIRNFFEEKGQLIKDISDEEFKKYVNSRLVEERKKDNNLSEEFLRNWREITRGGNVFDKKETAIKNLEKCVKEDFIKFWEKYFEKETTILDCEYVCETHYEENEKVMKEVKVNEISNIIKRKIADTIGEFKDFNPLFPNFNNEVYKSLVE